jgi:hypothetical protein
MTWRTVLDLEAPSSCVVLTAVDIYLNIRQTVRSDAFPSQRGVIRQLKIVFPHL